MRPALGALLLVVALAPAAEARLQAEATAKRSAAQLLQDLRSKDDAVSRAAERRLVEMGADAVPGLVQSLDGDSEVHALLVLRRLGPRAEAALPQLRRRLASEDRWRWLYAVTIASIKPAQGADLIPHLDAGLDEGESARSLSADALDRIGTPEALKVLTTRLRSADPAIRRVAAHALAGGKSPDADLLLPVLLELLASATDDAQREEGLLDIASLEREARPAVEALVGHYERGRGDVRLAAAEALAWVAPVVGAQVLPVLVEGLKDPRPVVRQRMASVIGQLGAPARQYRANVERLIEDPVVSVQEAARAAANGLKSKQSFTQPLEALRLIAIHEGESGRRAFFRVPDTVLDAEAGAWLQDGRIETIDAEAVTVEQDVVDERLRLTQRTVRLALFSPGARPLPAQPTRAKGPVAPISLALAGDGLPDVVSVFAKAGGLNLVLQHTARCAPQTVLMRAWPWDAALEHIFKGCGQEYEVEGTFVRVAARADFKRYRYEKRKYSGFPITMQFTRARLPDLWKLFEEVTGLKVEPHPDGESTLYCQDCPWDEVFAALTRSQGLAYETKGAVIRLKPLP